jgi:hypothetical protein
VLLDHIVHAPLRRLTLGSLFRLSFSFLLSLARDLTVRGAESRACAWSLPLSRRRS